MPKIDPVTADRFILPRLASSEVDPESLLLDEVKSWLSTDVGTIYPGLSVTLGSIWKPDWVVVEVLVLGVGLTGARPDAGTNGGGGVFVI